MKCTTTLTLAIGLALSSLAQADNEQAANEEFTTITANIPGLMSFEAADEIQTRDFNWEMSKHPRMLADVNGDGKDDLVGFGEWHVEVSFGNGLSFDNPSTIALSSTYSYQIGGWRIDSTPRMMADVNGDGKDDIVGIGGGGVAVSFSNGRGFNSPVHSIAQFGYNQGWRVNDHVRVMKDVNGDGKQDLVGFAGPGVLVATSHGNGFNEPQFWSDAFGNFADSGGWNNATHLRMMADINGDGKQDVVGFGADGVYTALSNGNGFDPQQFAIANFGYLQGWRVNTHPRIMADVNGDGKDDIVGFGDAGAVVSISTGTGSFHNSQVWLSDFATDLEAGKWLSERHPRMMADVTGDGLADIIGFADDGVYFARSTGTSFEPAKVLVNNKMGYNHGYRVDQHPRMIGDLNGNGKADIVAINNQGTEVAISQKYHSAIVARYTANVNSSASSNVSSISLERISAPGLSHISGKDTILGASNDGTIYNYDGVQWHSVPGKMQQVAVPNRSQTGTYNWALDANNMPHMGYPELDGAGNPVPNGNVTWMKMGNTALKQIAVGRYTFGINPQGGLMVFDTIDISWWPWLTEQKWSHISIFDSAIWGIDTTGKIFYNNDGPEFKQVSWNFTTLPKQIKAISQTQAVVLDSEGQLSYVRIYDDGFSPTLSVDWREIGTTGNIKHIGAVSYDRGEVSVVALAELSKVPPSSFELIGLDINGDGFYERVLKITNQAGDSILVYQPMAIAYLLKNMGIDMTLADIERFSPLQRKALAAQPQLQGLTVDDNGDIQSFDESQFNAAVDAIDAIRITGGSSGATWTTDRINDGKFGPGVVTERQSGSVQTYELTATTGSTTVTNKITFLYAENNTPVATSGLPLHRGTDATAYLVKLENTSTNGPLTTGTSITIGEVNSKMYVNDKGFAINQSITAVSAEGHVGAKNSSHVVVGAGAGAGVSMAGSWGQNGLYGGEFDIKFVKVGVYVSSSDATTAFNESAGWLNGAAQDTANWGEQSWQSCSAWFAQTADNTGTAVMYYMNHGKDWAVNAANDGKDVGMTVIDGAHNVTLKISDASEAAVNQVSDGVDTAIQTSGSVATNVSNVVADAGSIVGSQVESTADTIGDGIVDLGNMIVDGFCGIFGC